MGDKDKEKKPDEEAQEDDAGQDAPADSAKDMITTANDAAERLESANKVHEELLKREEELIAVRTLSGKTDAGQPAKTQEEKEIEAAKKLVEGTGLDPFA